MHNSTSKKMASPTEVETHLRDAEARVASQGRQGFRFAAHQPGARHATTELYPQSREHDYCPTCLELGHESSHDPKECRYDKFYYHSHSDKERPPENAEIGKLKQEAMNPSGRESASRFPTPAFGSDYKSVHTAIHAAPRSFAMTAFQSDSRAIDPATFEQLYQTNSNIFTDSAGRQFALFNGFGSFSQSDDESVPLIGGVIETEEYTEEESCTTMRTESQDHVVQPVAMCAFTHNATANHTLPEKPNPLIRYNHVAETGGESNETSQNFPQHSHILSKSEDALADRQEQETVKTMVTDRQEPEIEKEEYGQLVQDIYEWAGAKKYCYNGENAAFSMDELNVHQTPVHNGTVHHIGDAESFRDFPKFIGIDNNQAKLNLHMMEKKFIEPLKVKVKPKIEDIIMNQHGTVSGTQTGVIFAEQDHNFKHSGEKVTQFTSMDHTAETVETQDHNFRHAVDYSSTSSN